MSHASDLLAIGRGGAGGPGSMGPSLARAMTVIVFSGEHLAQARLGSQSVRPVQDPLMALMPDTMEAVPEARELPEADPAR